MINLIYYMFYCSSANDDLKTKHEMTAYGMEIVTLSSFAVIGALGVAAAPWVAGVGIVYGVSSICFESSLNNALDISKSINFVEPQN